MRFFLVSIVLVIILLNSCKICVGKFLINWLYACGIVCHVYACNSKPIRTTSGFFQVGPTVNCTDTLDQSESDKFVTFWQI
jgi:hypothetical protein